MNRNLQVNLNRKLMWTVLAITLLSLFVTTFQIEQAEASGSIHITADGNVNPPTALIQQSANIYTLTGNIAADIDGIFIERNNILLNGAGHIIQGTGNGTGIILVGISNVTILNLKIQGFCNGITLVNASDNVIIENSIESNCQYGIWLNYSANNRIYHNNFINNTKQAYNQGAVNVWDSSYPSGGNYWDNYNGADNYSGTSQNVLGGDGMGDTSQYIDENNRDNYPLMKIWHGPVRNLNTGQSYSDIQGAINDASEDQKVLALSRTYYGNIVVNKSIQLLGEQKETTIIDGNWADVVVSINASNVKISGFTIQRAMSTNLLLNYSSNDSITGNCITTSAHDGILLRNSSNNNISRNTITSSLYYGIRLESSSYNIVNQNKEAKNFDGILLDNSSNNNVTENNITANHNCGIKLYSSSNYNSIDQNNVTANEDDGVKLYSSNNNAISGNNITANADDGIVLYEYSNHNDVIGNNITNNNDGIALHSFSDYNNLSGNILTNNENGIILDSSSNNSFLRNNLTNSYDGFYLTLSLNNTVDGNDIRNCNTGIILDRSSGNVLRDNRITSNERNLDVVGQEISDFLNEIDSSNLVGGKPVYYWVNRQDSAVPNDAGYVALVNCTRITIQDLNLTSNGQGLLLVSVTNAVIRENNIINNRNGIYIIDSSNNTIYHNNVVNNIRQVYTFNSTNAWDDGYPSGGNHWSDYTGVDYKSGPNQDLPGSDLIGDQPYIIDTNNTDHYPLMSLYGVTPIYPTAAFNYLPNDPIARQTLVVFNASDSKCPNGTIETFLWSFGDGAYGAGSVTSHIYNSYGKYTVTLTVVSNTGSSNTTSQFITVRETPVATFAFSPTSSLSAGHPITFDASSSSPRGGILTVYVWDFGDGNITLTTSPAVVHTYAFPEFFYVTLTVFDNENLNSSTTQAVLVNMPTFVSISTSSSCTFAGYAVDISGTLCDFYENGLEGEPVAISYTLAGNSTWFPISSGITDHSGHYYAQWIPPASGYFTIKAEWAGNATHYGASNNVTLSSLPYMNQYVFSVESNSTLSELAFNMTRSELNFTVSGPSGTTGYAKVTIAKSLVENATNIKVYLDGNESEYLIASTGDSWILAFTYSHSTHKVTVDLSNPQVDLTPPVTTNDYDGLWHTMDFTINLSATDQGSGVLETFYRINDGSTQNVSANGQPLIRVESFNNTLEYWSIDKAANEETHHVLMGIKLDKTIPTGSILINNGAIYTNSTSVALNLTANDAISGVYQVRVSNDGVWDTELWEPFSPTRSWTLSSGDGTKTVYFQVKDYAGLVSSTYTSTILLDTTKPSIAAPLRSPSGDVQPNQPVMISVNVTDYGSGVKSVRLAYFTNKSATGLEFSMILNQTSGFYESTIPGQEAGTLVNYQITAYDLAGNSVTNDNAGQYYVYTVVPEFSTLIILQLFMIATLLTVVLFRRKRARSMIK